MPSEAALPRSDGISLAPPSETDFDISKKARYALPTNHRQRQRCRRRTPRRRADGTRCTLRRHRRCLRRHAKRTGDFRRTRYAHRTNLAAEQSHRPVRRTRRSRRRHRCRRTRMRVKRLGIHRRNHRRPRLGAPHAIAIRPHPNFRPPVDYPLLARSPRRLPSTSASIPDSPSAPAATRPRASASNGWIRNSKTAKASSTTAAVRAS